MLELCARLPRLEREFLLLSYIGKQCLILREFGQPKHFRGIAVRSTILKSDGGPAVKLYLLSSVGRRFLESLNTLPLTQTMGRDDQNVNC